MIEEVSFAAAENISTGEKQKDGIRSAISLRSPSSDQLLNMNDPQTNNPLHGVTLEMMVTQLVEHYGWDELGRIIDIRCFNFDPSIASSLKFLRKTPWARTKVEQLYLRMQKRKGRS